MPLSAASTEAFVVASTPVMNNLVSVMSVWYAVRVWQMTCGEPDFALQTQAQHDHV